MGGKGETKEENNKNLVKLKTRLPNKNFGKRFRSKFIPACGGSDDGGMNLHVLKFIELPIKIRSILMYNTLI